MLKTNYKFGEVYALASQLTGDDRSVQFKNIFENANGGVSLLAFKSGQKLDTHLAPAEVMIYVTEGEVEFTMADRKHLLHAGDFMLMGEGVPHSVEAKTDARLVLIKIKASV